MKKRGKYWVTVAARAWAETIATAQWSSNVKFISAMVAGVVTAAVGWRQTGELATGALWGLVAVAAITLGTFVWKLWWAVPADLSAEATDRENRLKSALETYNSAEDDEELRSAIAYVATGKWAASYWEGGGEAINVLGGVLEDIRKRAQRGKLHIWGRRATPVGLHVRIPEAFWEVGRIELLTVTAGADEVVTTTKYVAHDPSRYHDLRANRAEFEREWAR